MTLEQSLLNLCLSLHLIVSFLMFPTEDDTGAKPEAVNKKALQIVSRVKDKLTGKLRTILLM